MNSTHAIRIGARLLLAGAMLPMIAGSYTLDAPSPSLTGTEDIMNDTGGVPTVGLTLSTLGLSVGDAIDAISLGDDPVWVPVHGPHDHLFSVQRQSLGLAGSAVEAERLGDTPPGATPGHLSDVFFWSHAAVGTNTLAPAGLGWNGGGGDEANAGLVNTGAGDNVSALESAVMSHSGSLPPFEVYFSLAAGSPTLSVIGAGPGDILAVGGFFGAAPIIFRSAASLGIPAGVTIDLDAMTLEVEPGPAGPVLRIVQFSVTSATATGWTYGGIGIVDSGADVLVYDNITPAAFVGHRPADFGLLVSDDIDGLELVLAPAPAPCTRSDTNADGIINVTDLLNLLADWGPCPP